MSDFNLKKGIFVFAILGMIAAALWFIFKPYDYTIAFKSKADIGTINQTLKSWNSSLEKNQPIQQTEMNDMQQTLRLDGKDYDFHWQLSKIGDSTTQVDIGVKELQNSLINRMNILFMDSPFETYVKDTISDYIKTLDTHLERFKVKVVGESSFATTYCAYIPIKSKQSRKARGMMENYGILSTFLEVNGVKLNGRPMVEITSWDTKTDSISYNFCYPMIKKEGLPEHPSIRYKELKGTKALKAIYNGNYITSDRAWYALIDYAEHKNIEVQKTPIEVFINNPNFGGDELNWQAEIYMPLKIQ